MALDFFTDSPTISDNGRWLIPSRNNKYNNAPIVCIEHITSVKYYSSKTDANGTYIHIQTKSSEEKLYYESTENMVNDYYIIIDLLTNIKSNLSID